MDWRIWLALGIGSILGANLGVLLMGLLVAVREDKENRLRHWPPAGKHNDAMILERSGYGNLN